jgi:hypothetical protein
MSVQLDVQLFYIILDKNEIYKLVTKTIKNIQFKTNIEFDV